MTFSRHEKLSTLDPTHNHSAYTHHTSAKKDHLSHYTAPFNGMYDAVFDVSMIIV